MGITVKLTIEEYGRAIQCGYERWSQSLRSGRSDRLFDKSWSSGLQVHIDGAVGELAAARGLGCYAPLHVNQFSGMRADLLRDVEVRHRNKPGHQLIVRDGDPDDRRYLLTRGTPPEIEVVGWIRGADAKNPDYLQDYGGHGAAYFVPDWMLFDVEELK